MTPTVDVFDAFTGLAQCRRRVTSLGQIEVDISISACLSPHKPHE